jgi:hypothetical protein
LLLSTLSACICFQMDITIRVELHFGIDRAHAEGADIEIEIKSKPKWPQMKAKWATLTSPNYTLRRTLTTISFSWASIVNRTTWPTMCLVAKCGLGTRCE